MEAPVAQLLNARARHQTHLAARSSMLGSVIARALCSELSQLGNNDAPPRAYISSRRMNKKSYSRSHRSEKVYYECSYLFYLHFRKTWDLGQRSGQIDLLSIIWML